MPQEDANLPLALVCLGDRNSQLAASIILSVPFVEGPSTPSTAPFKSVSTLEAVLPLLFAVLVSVSALGFPRVRIGDGKGQPAGAFTLSVQVSASTLEALLPLEV